MGSQSAKQSGRDREIPREPADGGDRMTRKAMEKQPHTSNLDPETWRIATTLNFLLSKIVGKYAAYPEVDPEAFQRIHSTVAAGLQKLRAGSRLGDFCQELRSVLSCPVEELLRAEGADDVDTRITAVAQVVRQNTGMPESTFRELLSGLLSWGERDKSVILGALVEIIRG